MAKTPLTQRLYTLAVKPSSRKDAKAIETMEKEFQSLPLVDGKKGLVIAQIGNLTGKDTVTIKAMVFNVEQGRRIIDFVTKIRIEANQ